jgi:hypothetical protein
MIAASWFVLPGAMLMRRPRRTGCVARFVAIALGCGILLRPGALGAILFLEPIARILVRATGTPVGAAPLGGGPIVAPRQRGGSCLFVKLEIVPLRLARRP